MLEVEVKADVEEPEKMKSKFEILKCKFLRKEIQKDIYFTSSFRDFKKTGEVLRVRKLASGKDVVTFKGPRLESRVKAREEIEIGVESSFKTVKLLERLGYKPWITIEKERAIYKFDEFTLSLDKVKDLGHFLEIERIVEGTQSHYDAEKEILDLLKKLGIPESKVQKRTYLELILEKYEDVPKAHGNYSQESHINELDQAMSDPT